MRTRVDFKNTVGKTVEAVHEPRTASLLVLFTDGTYAYAEAEGDDRDNYLEELDYVIADPYDTRLAVRYGLMTADEKAAKDRQMADEKAAATAAKEKAEYERLRAKFGG